MQGAIFDHYIHARRTCASMHPRHTVHPVHKKPGDFAVAGFQFSYWILAYTRMTAFDYFDAALLSNCASSVEPSSARTEETPP